MQNSYITDAINLKSYNLSEADKIIVMYTKDKGLVKGIAKGVKKTKSKLGARMDLLVANKVMLHKGRTFNTICQADSLNTFRQTRTDLDKIFYSMYIAEIVNNFGLEGDPSSEKIYNLLYDALENVSNAENLVEILITVIKFQLKMMKETGFSLELDNCLICRQKINSDIMYLVPDLGGVICKDCSDKVHYSKKQIPVKLRDFFKAMYMHDFSQNEYFEQRANEKVCTVTYDFLRKYIEKRCPKKFKSSEVLESLSA